MLAGGAGCCGRGCRSSPAASTSRRPRRSAAATGSPRDDVLNLIASLVNKSIVVRHQATEHTTAWYQMLETIRQYGAERLADGRAARAAVRHRDHYRSLAQRFAAEGFGPDQADWFIRLRREHGNLRAALELCLEDPAEAPAAFDIAAPLWNFWFAGFLREGYRYLVRALELATEPTRGRAHGLWAAGYLAMIAGDLERNAARCWPRRRARRRGSTTTCSGPGSRSAGATRRSTTATSRLLSRCSRTPAPLPGARRRRSASSTR